MLTPLATPTPTPTAAPEPTRSPAPTSTPVPTQSPEPECRENFILEGDECICERESFILRGGNCYPVCGTAEALSDSICVCPDEYEKDDFGNCQPKCDKKTSDLIGDKCLPKPGKHEKRVINGDVFNYICDPGYKHDKNNICQKDTKEPVDNPKKSSLFGGFFGGSQSNSMPTPIATPEVTLPTPTSNPAPTASTLEKQKKKEQPKQKPKVKKECYNIKNGDRIIQFDNGKTICQNFLLGKVRDCVEECPDDKD